MRKTNSDARLHIESHIYHILVKYIIRRLHVQSLWNGDSTLRVAGLVRHRMRDALGLARTPLKAHPAHVLLVIVFACSAAPLVQSRVE